jgi:hypothetical protein
MNYTKEQQRYIESVGGAAHISAVEIIGELERKLEAAGSKVEIPMGSAELNCPHCGAECVCSGDLDLGDRTGTQDCDECGREFAWDATVLFTSSKEKECGI